MYEPKNLPQLNETISTVSGMRFSIVHYEKYRKIDSCMRSGFSDCSHFIILFKKK